MLLSVSVHGSVREALFESYATKRLKVVLFQNSLPSTTQVCHIHTSYFCEVGNLQLSLAPTKLIEYSLLSQIHFVFVQFFLHCCSLLNQCVYQTFVLANDKCRSVTLKYIKQTILECPVLWMSELCCRCSSAFMRKNSNYWDNKSVCCCR